MKMKTTTQAPAKGTSAPQNTATKSGSRPMGSKYPIASSAPSSVQKIRG